MVALPDPSKSYQSGVVCLRGNLDRYNRMSGMWAAGLDLILAGPRQNTGGMLCRFEYDHEHNHEHNEPSTATFPVSGRYIGWFELAKENGTVTRVKERFVLRFRENNAGFRNVDGEGENRFGGYTISGTLTNSGFLTMFRHFERPKINAALKTTRKGKKRAKNCKKRKRQLEKSTGPKKRRFATVAVSESTRQLAQTQFNFGGGLDDLHNDDDDNDIGSVPIAANWNLNLKSTVSVSSNKSANEDDDWGDVCKEAAAAKAMEAERRARQEKVRANIAPESEEIRARRLEEESNRARLEERREKEAEEEARRAAKEAVRAQLSQKQTVDLDAQRNVMKDFEFGLASDACFSTENRIEADFF